jgi:hypothetical protein
VTEVFVNLSRTASQAQGYPALPTLVLPHPMEARPEAEIRAICRARLGELIGLLSAEA